MSFDLFTQFVNDELPKRLSTNVNPLTVPPGWLFVTTGVGLGMELADPDQFTFDGKSAYQIALENGFEGTEAQWLESIQGKSIYRIAQDLGFEGTEAEFLASLNGTDGQSAYELAVALGFEGTEEQWLTGLIGKSAYQHAVDNGYEGSEAEWLASLQGQSAYQTAVANGFEGTEEEWLTSLQGERGDTGLSAYELAQSQGFDGDLDAWLEHLQGESGQDGTDGIDGRSAYEIASANGFQGTEVEWLDSLRGVDGADGADGEQGLSAYEVAVANGFEGTEAEWLDSLHTDLTPEILQSLLAQRGYSVKDLLKVVASSGNSAVTANSGLFNFLFLFDKRIEQDLERSDKASQYMVEMGRMEAEGYSYWKNEPGNGTSPKPEGIPESEIRLYDTGVLQIGSLEKYIEFGNGANITIADGETTDVYNLAEITQGADGKSAYELALEHGFEGTEADWLQSLAGKSAYEIAFDHGFDGTEEHWLETLKGEPGQDGTDGEAGADGKSAYELAVEQGFEGSVSEWLLSLEGSDAELNSTVLQQLLLEKGYSVKNFLKVLGSTAAVSARSGWHNYLFLFDPALQHSDTLLNSGKAEQRVLEMGRVEATGLSYWKNTAGGGTTPRAPNVPDAEVRLLDTGFLEIGSATDYIQFGDGSKITVVKDDASVTYDLSAMAQAGKSAYELAIDNGFEGSLEEWLTSLVGRAGVDGKSAYELAVDGGFEGTVEEWLASLHGEPLTPELLQTLLSARGYSIKDVLKVTGTGAVASNAGFHNFLFLFDKRIEQDLTASNKASQYMVEMGRMEAEGYSYWKNEPANGANPKPPRVAESEIRLYDDGRLQIGSLSSYLEFNQTGITHHTTDRTAAYAWSALDLFTDYQVDDATKVLTHTGTGAAWQPYPFSDQFHNHMINAGFVFDEAEQAWAIDQGELPDPA